MPDPTNQYDPILKSYQSSVSPPPIPPLHPLPPPILPPPVPPSPEPKSSGKLAKFFFFISLIIFISVFSLILYTVFDQNKQSVLSIPPSPTPFPTADNLETVDYCLLNDQHILVGDTLPAGDDCNLCLCQPDLSIFCTSKSCDQ